MFDKLTELVEDAVGNVYLESDSLEYTMELSDVHCGSLQNLSVTVNGERYKII